MNKWEKIGVVGVDAGLVWIGDPCYCVTPDANEHPAKTWKEFCDKILKHGIHEKGFQQFNYKLGHPGLGVCVTSGIGDGVYEVFARRNSEGSIMEVRINFEEYAE